MGDESYQQLRYNEYSKQSGELFKTNVELGGRYDQWMLTLSGGAIALSLAFLEKIASHPEPNTLFLLGLAWLFLMLALMAGAQTRAQQRVELAASLQGFESAEGGDHALAHLALIPKAFDNLEIGVGAGAFEAKILYSSELFCGVSSGESCGATGGMTQLVRGDRTAFRGAELCVRFARTVCAVFRGLRVASLISGHHLP